MVRGSIQRAWRRPHPKTMGPFSCLVHQAGHCFPGTPLMCIILTTWMPLAMDWLPRAHCSSGMAHQTGCLPTQVAPRCEGWSHARPIMTHWRRQGLILDHSGIQLEVLFEPPRSEGAAVHWHYDTTIEWALCSAAILIDFLASMNLVRDLTLDCAIHQYVGEPTHLSLSTAGKYAGKLFATMGNYWYKPNLRNIPTSSWRGTEWSGELVVLKRRFTVSLSLLDVLSGFWGGVVILCLLFLLLFYFSRDIQSFAHLSAL